MTAGAGETVTISDDIASDGYRDPNDATNSDPAGDGLDGGVKMSGGGLLNLHGTNSYLGGTQVSGGGTVNIIADKGLGHSSESSLWIMARSSGELLLTLHAALLSVLAGPY
ncbi:hypothetical protein HED50_12660 [Ochrobactrum oryzae]|nr:hypothetical protein [Brucella oryzae]